MKGCFRFIARSLAVLSAILFVITAVIAIVFFNLENRVFNPDTYKTALAEGFIYERLPRIFSEEIVLSMNYDPCKSSPMVCEIEGASDEFLACLADALGQDALEEIFSGKRLPTEADNILAKPCIERYGGTPKPENVSEGGAPQFFKNLKPEDWEFILMKFLPPDDSRFMIETTLDQIFAYLKGDTEMAVLPLGQLKARLTGAEGIEVLERLIITQPACSEDELARMKASIKGTLESEMVLCNPSENELQDMLPDLQNQLLQVVADLPDEAILIQPPDPASTSDTASENLGGGLLIARTILRLSPLIPLGFLILITLFTVRSLKGWLHWWGIPFIIVGGIGILIGLLVTPIMQFAWVNLVEFPPYLSPTLVDLAQELLTYIVHSITETVVLSSILLAVVGVGAMVGALFTRPKSGDSGAVSA
jgi:hypothetical protein